MPSLARLPWVDPRWAAAASASTAPIGIARPAGLVSDPGACMPMRICPSPNLCLGKSQPAFAEALSASSPTLAQKFPCRPSLMAVEPCQAVSPPLPSDCGPAAASSGSGLKKKGSGKAKAAAKGNKENLKHELFEGAVLTKESVVELSKTQAGSKFLQRKLLKGHPSIIQEILDGIEVELPSIMCDMYGNYLCSAAFQACSVAQRQRMLELATRHLKEVATDRWGTHSLQALISLICTSEEQNLLMNRLRDSLVELCCDANGVHAVQRSLLSFGQSLLDVILQEVLHNLRTFAQHPHGLGFIKKCISECRDVSSQKQLIEGLSIHALDLCRDQFGNYAVQHALEEWGAEACGPIIQALSERLVQLSLQKFSSNVVESMLLCAPIAVRRQFLEELTTPQHLNALMSNTYGHYVARRALQIADAEQKATIEKALTQGVQKVKNRWQRLRWERVLQDVGEATGPRLDEPPEL